MLWDGTPPPNNEYAKGTRIPDLQTYRQTEFGFIMKIWYCYEEWTHSYLGIYPQIFFISGSPLSVFRGPRLWTALKKFIHFLYGNLIYFLMRSYSIHPWLLDSFRVLYFSPRNICYQTRDPVKWVITSKAVTLSISNSYYITHFLGALIFVCMVTIFKNNIFNLIFSTLSE